MNAVKQFLNTDVRLPSPPAIALRIIEAVKDDGFSFDQLGSIIESDPALAGRILRLGNSQIYALPRRVNTVKMAIAVLGVNALKNIALSFTLAEVFNKESRGRFDVDRLWRRSITAAAAAHLISQEIGFQNEETFITGLLQDIGVGAMFVLAQDKYLAVLDEKTATGLPVAEVERKIFGFDHTELGAELLQMWGLPEAIYTPIRYHHDPKSAPLQFRALCKVLEVSDRLSAVYHGTGTVKNFHTAQELLMRMLGLSESQTSALIDAVAEKSVELISQFNIDPRQLKPFSQILQEANEGLSRVNLSYEMLVVDLKEAKEKAEQLAIDLKTANERLREAAIRDGLTGLFNHRYFQEAIVAELARAVRYQHPVGLVMLDIDHFKTVNDKYGHQIGDYMIRMIAGQIAKGSRISDVVARHGGEEFAIILPETDLQGAAAKGESCRRAIESMDFSTGSELVRATVSVGVAMFDPRDPVSKDELIEAADRALYRSKREGRNRVTLSTVRTFQEL